MLNFVSVCLFESTDGVDGRRTRGVLFATGRPSLAGCYAGAGGVGGGQER